jgi:NAD(P)-dependent dehydrogenase (short-subunit alcohol dehydrogenase family)
MPYWRSFGDKPWRGERPVVAPVLLVHGRKPPPNVLGAEIRAGEEQRGAFANAAAQFGKDVRIPSDAELLGWSASVGHFPSEPPPGWSGKWRMRWQGADYNGASAGSITTRHFAISCAGSCSPPPEPVRPTLEELSRLGWRQGGAPFMKRQRRGPVLNIASVAGSGPTGSSIAYAVAKAGSSTSRDK